MRLARLILLSLLLASPALAQTNCPGSTYLGWGYGWKCDANGANCVRTPIYVSFPNGAGTATLDKLLVTTGSPDYPTCDPDTWNARDLSGNKKFYGTIAYNDGTINYSGAVEFRIEFAPAAQTNCIPDKDYIPRFWMIGRLKIQSCTAGHTLTNRFIAVNCGGDGVSGADYCEQETSEPCSNPGAWVHQNYINLSISGL